METMIRAEKLAMTGFPMKRGWLIVTDARVVFSDKEQLGSKEHWSVPIDRIDSVVAKKSWGAGSHQLEILYTDPAGKRQKKVFENFSLTSSLMGMDSRLEGNRLEGLERTIEQRRELLRTPRPVPNDRFTDASVAAELERLAALRDRGVLSEAEFAAAKAKALER